MRPGIDTELINFKFQVMRNVPGMYSLVFISIILAYGCNPVLVPLKGKYSDRAFEITTTQSIDSVWSKLTDIFTTNGLPIKSIEKKKGTVLTVKQPINSLYTFEGKDGQLEHPQAWVVLTKVFNKKKEWKPRDIYGQWSIQITETEKAITTIKIDPIVICTYFPNTFTTMESRGQSTGQLEELLERSLRNN